MGVIVTDQHFLMLQTLPERIHHEQVRKFWGKVYAQFLQEEKHVIYKRESGLLNPLEHLTSNIHGDSIHVEVPQVNENQTDEFCDVEASKITTAFSLGIFANILLALLLKVTFIKIFRCDVFLFLDNLVEVNYTVPSEAKLDSLFIFPQLDPITLEIALFLDSELFEHFKREFTSEPVEHLTEFSLALINNVHVLYQQPVSLGRVFRP